MKKLILLLSVIFAFSACEKDPDMERLEDDYLVYTNHDSKTNFKILQTFYLPSRILIISDDETSTYLDEETTESILSAYTENMEERGYRLTYNKTEADLGIQISYIQSNRFFAGHNTGQWWWQYPSYWTPDYWGNWEEWHYPFETNYSYNTNSFLIEMVNLHPIQAVSNLLPVVWNSYLTGFKTGTRHIDLRLLTKAIRQSFEQSPYLTNH